MINLHFHLQPQFKYELFHIYFTSFHSSQEYMNLIGLAPNVWLHSSVGRASHWYRGGHGFKSRWSPDFFQASPFQVLKLENLLWWSFFTFIYNCSSNMNYFIYTSHHFTPHRNIWTQLIGLASNVWLHSSVGRALHQYRGGHGFESALIFSGFFPIA